MKVWRGCRRRSYPSLKPSLDREYPIRPQRDLQGAGCCITVRHLLCRPHRALSLPSQPTRTSPQHTTSSLPHTYPASNQPTTRTNSRQNTQPLTALKLTVQHPHPLQLSPVHPSRPNKSAPRRHLLPTTHSLFPSPNTPHHTTPHHSPAKLHVKIKLRPTPTRCAVAPT